MITNGADGGRLLADDQMPAVAALPHGLLALFKNALHLDIIQQGAVPFLVGLLNGGNGAEFAGQLGKALLLGLLGKGRIHISPLVILTLGGVQQVLGGIAQLTQRLKPHLGVFLLVFGGLGKNFSDLLVAFLLGYTGEIGVFIAGLRFTGKGGQQVLFGLGAFQFHGSCSFHAVKF